MLIFAQPIGGTRDMRASFLSSVMVQDNEIVVTGYPDDDSENIWWSLPSHLATVYLQGDFGKGLATASDNTTYDAYPVAYFLGLCLQRSGPEEITINVVDQRAVAFFNHLKTSMSDFLAYWTKDEQMCQPPTVGDNNDDPGPM